MSTTMKLAATAVVESAGAYLRGETGGIWRLVAERNGRPVLRWKYLP